MRPAAVVLFLLACALVPLEARANEIWVCEDGDGSMYIGNSRQPGMRCRLEARGGAPRPRSAGVTPPPGGRVDTRGLAPAPVALPTGDRFTRFDAIIEEASRMYQLPAAFIRAVVKVESNFNPNAVSHVGAMGLMQLMPQTARNMGVINPFDPRQNIFGGARYLRVLANLFNGDLVLTIAAFNAGEGAVSRYRGIPPYEETRRYVQRVLHHYYSFRTGTGRIDGPR